MGNNRHTPPSSKPVSQPGIRSSDPRDISQRLEALEKLVRDSLDEKNLWNAKVREWIGKRVQVHTLIPTIIDGVLLWMDRYTLCIHRKNEPFETIVHKGAIATINRLPD